MHVFRTLIVDDELHGRENLKALLARHCSEVQIVGEASTAAEAIQALDDLRPDLVFLDILMPQASGFDVLESFPERRFAVIFVTASMEFGIRAVKAGVLDYLLKPISIRELKQAVARVGPYLHSVMGSQQDVSRIALTHSGGFTIEDIRDIVRLQADDNYTRVFTASGKQYLISRPLKDFERTLPEGIFIRTHKSYMINIHHLKDYTYEDGGTAVLQDGVRVPVSKRKNTYVIGALRKFSLMLKP